ncbi:MAG: undecaprenyl-diphosphate phosphatase [Chordicoccus sp.]
MDVLISVLAGVVQGLTEFIPVSSSGILVVIRQMTGFTGDEALAYLAFLHLGTLAALCICLQNDLKKMARELLRMLKDIRSNAALYMRASRSGEEPRYARIVTTTYRRLVVMTLSSTLMTALVGLVLRKAAVKVSGSCLYTGAGFILSGVILLVMSMLRPQGKVVKEIPLRSAFWTGIVQGFSVIPGLSRSGVTISASILSGFRVKSAVRFSYLISVPAVLGAFVFELFAGIGAGTITGHFLMTAIPGAIAAAFTGMLVIRSMLKLTRSAGSRPFAYLSFLLGIIAVAVSFAM